MVRSSRAVVGADLAEVVPYRPGFLEVCFTEREHDWIGREGWELGSRIWTAKEAAFKASPQGSGFSPRKYEVSEGPTKEAVWVQEAGRKSTALRVETWRQDGHAAAICISRRDACGAGIPAEGDDVHP
jgi:hypothetical protein